MVKDIIDKNENVTPNSKEIEVLKEHFPYCFRNDGSFDLERFKEVLKSDVDVTNEGYELKFLGKNYARLLASLDTATVIVPDEEHNSKLENKDSKNVYISGDNLDGLKHLLKSFNGDIDCIYIDPPYNTGSDGFAYIDSFKFTTIELSEKLSITEEQAKRILDLTTRGSASHSAWLMFIYPRLLLARDLLSKDGVIFISVDDNEQANMKLVCNDVFGEENCVANIIVQANKRGQTYKQLAKTHEYLLVYTRDVNTELNELVKSDGAFNKRDSIGEFEERELRNRNPKYGRFNRPNLFYPIYANPNITDECGYSPISLKRDDEFSIEILPYNSSNEESCWRWGQKKFNQYNNSDNSMESELVAKKKTTGEYGVYEKYRKGTYKAKTIWYEDNIVGELSDEEDDIWEDTGVITEQGSTELGRYKMEDAFDFPKPSYLIKKLLRIGTKPESKCLDFFSGSATTIDAVLSLNEEDGGERSVIAIQLPEDLDERLKNATSAEEKQKAQKVIDFLDSINCVHTLDYVGIERAKRAKERILSDNPDSKHDIGFKHYFLQEPDNDCIDKLEKFDPADNGFIITNGILEEFGEPTVLATWLVRDGYGFNPDVEKIDFAGYPGHYVGKHLYLIQSKLSNEAIAAITDKYESDGSFNPENIVLFGYSFTWAEMETLKTNLARLREEEKNLRINYDVRY